MALLRQSVRGGRRRGWWLASGEESEFSSKAPLRYGDVLRVEFVPHVVAIEFPRHHSGSACTHERIENHSVFGAAGLDAVNDKVRRERGEVGLFERFGGDGPYGAFVGEAVGYVLIARIDGVFRICGVAVLCAAETRAKSRLQ